MKLKYLIASLFFIPSALWAQEYHPLLAAPAWNINVANFGGQYSLVIEPGVNVLVNSVTYMKFNDPYFNNDVFLREDVAARRVYKLVGGADELLYDFSLQDGDFITMPNGVTYTAMVSTVQVQGGLRKRVYLYHDFFAGSTWVEGVGSTQHPFVHSYTLPSDPYIYLTCSTQDGVPVYNHGIANGGSPTDCSMLATDTFTPAEFYARLSPNPITQTATLSLSTGIQGGTLLIYNAQGQMVGSKENLYGRTITLDRDGLACGIYLLRLIDTSGFSVLKQMVVN